MTKFRKKLLLTLCFVMAISLFCFGCNKNNSAPPNEPANPPTPPVVSAQLPENQHRNVDIGDAVDAIYLGGCEFQSVSFDDVVLESHQYILNNGYIALRHVTYEEIGTNLHECEITTVQGKFTVSFFVKGYVGEYKTNDKQKTLNISNEMKTEIDGNVYDVYIKGEALKLINTQNVEDVKTGVFFNGIILTDELYSINDLPTKFSVVSGIEIDVSDLKIFDGLKQGCEVSHIVSDGINEIAIDQKDSFKFETNKDYTLKVNLEKGDNIDVNLELDIETTDFAEIDFATDQEDLSLFNVNTNSNIENVEFDSRSVSKLTGSTFLNAEVINSARAAGYWTITFDVFVPTTETGKGLFLLTGYIEGGNKYIHQTNSAYSQVDYAPGGHSACVNITSDYRGTWKTLYLDLSNYYDDETMFMKYEGDYIYYSNFKFHYIPQDFSIDTLDLATYGEYMVIPSFAAAIRGYVPSYNKTSGELELPTLSDGGSGAACYSLLRGLLVSPLNAGYDNIILQANTTATNYKWSSWCGWNGAAYFKNNSIVSSGNYTSSTLALYNLVNNVNPSNTDAVWIGTTSLMFQDRKHISLTVSCWTSSPVSSIIKIKSISFN